VATFIARYETFREKIENLDYMDELIERTTTTRMKTYTSSSTNVRQTPQRLKKHLRTDNAITTMKECGGCGSRFHAWQGCKLIEKALKPRTHSGLLVYETKERIEKWLDKGQNRHLALRNLDKGITKTDENMTDKLSVSKMEGRIDGGCNATTNFAPRPGMFRKASSLARAQIRTSATI
jgi:hypothetical protein